MSRLLVVVLTVLVTSCSVSRPSEDASGEEVYQLLCANCHGVDLEGGALGPSLGADSVSASQPDAFIEFAIVNGKGSMPSFESVLNDSQVDRLVGYIRQVQDQG